MSVLQISPRGLIRGFTVTIGCNKSGSLRYPQVLKSHIIERLEDHCFSIIFNEFINGLPTLTLINSLVGVLKLIFVIILTVRSSSQTFFVANQHLTFNRKATASFSDKIRNFPTKYLYLYCIKMADFKKK